MNGVIKSAKHWAGNIATQSRAPVRAPVKVNEKVAVGMGARSHKGAAQVRQLRHVRLPGEASSLYLKSSHHSFSKT